VNKYYNIKDGNAPPKKRQKFKVKRQKSFRMGTLYFLLSPFSLTSRDGPRGREPANRVPVTLLYPDSYRDSVALCVFSASSAVKKKTTDDQKSTGQHRAIIIMLRTMSFRVNCTDTIWLQEESLFEKGLYQIGGYKSSPSVPLRRGKRAEEAWGMRRRKTA